MEISDFISNKSAHSLELYHHFLEELATCGSFTLEPAKTMIGISNGHRRIAWITHLGKNFLHVVFPFREPYTDNLCFCKVGQVPGSNQYNHHFRMYAMEDINSEVKHFMRLALG